MDASPPIWMVPIMVVCLVVASCGEDNSQNPSPGGTVCGTVTEVVSGEPVSDAVVLLIDAESLGPGSKLTDVTLEGTYQIDEVEPGTYGLAVLHDTLLVFDRSEPLLYVDGGATVVCDVRLQGAWWNSPTYRISGTVVDSESLKPICHAYIESIPGAFRIPELLLGLSTAYWTVTDAEGRFSIGASAFVNVDGQTTGLLPVTVARAGYEPTTLVGTEWSELPYWPLLPPPEEGDSTLVVEVRLRKISGDAGGPHGAGAIRGRVTFLGAPISDLRVALSIDWVADPDTIPRFRLLTATPIAGNVATTDENGEFLIAGLTPGYYLVEPGYLPDDGYTYEATRSFYAEVTAGDTLDVRDLGVSISMTPEYPEDQSIIIERTPEFRWEPVSDTLGHQILDYSLSFFGAGYSPLYIIDEIGESTWQVPDSLALVPGTHVRWHVRTRAVRTGTQDIIWIAAMEGLRSFTVSQQ